MVAASRGLAEPRLSPSGRRLAWVETVRGGSDLVVVAVDGGPPVVVTADSPGVARSGSYGGGIFTWVGDDHLAYASAEGALVAVRATGGPARTLCRDGRAFAPAGSPDGGRVAFLLERQDSADVAVVPLDGSQWPVRVTDGADFALDPSWSPDGRTLAWHEWDLPEMPWDSSRIALRPLDGLALDGPVRIAAGGSGVAVGQPRFSPDGTRLAYVSDQGGWANVWVSGSADGSGAGPLLEEEAESAEPTWGSGQRSFAWSPEGGRIAWCRNAGGFASLVVAPIDRARGGAEMVGKGWHRGLDWRGELLTAVRSGPRSAPGVVLGVPGGGWREVARGPVAGFERAGLVEPEAVSWAGAGGAVVHGLLYRPRCSDPSYELPPLIVGVHGGPTSAELADWAPRRQFWLARGWAVLLPNYRGSTGYGRAYAQALRHGWGETDVADVAAGIEHAGRAGWADADRVAVVGGSAGGLTVLLVCALHPGLVRAGIDIFGVTDLFDLAETTHRFESRYLDALVGTLPLFAARYRDRSPVTHLDRLTTPLLVLQGGRDLAVPKAQADALVDGLRSRGRKVDYHVYEDEGHGWSRPATVADELERSEAFLTRHVLRR